ncbi:MAG: hypothetical protein ACWGHH_01205 [Sulfurovaceae bacterium]
MSINVDSIYQFGVISELQLEDKYILFHGKILDDRSELVKNYFEGAMEIYEIKYNEHEYCLHILNNQEMKNVTNKDIKNKFLQTIPKDINTYYIDATSLGFAELLLLLHNIHELKNNNIVIKLLYLEPKEYKLKSENSLYDDEFDLSSKFNDFKKIPPYSVLIDSSSSSKAELIVTLGFENNRLANIMEDDDGAIYEKYSPILALPAFVPGWENISLRKHYKELKSFKSIDFSPANNPYETQKVLERICKNSRYGNIVVAPIGTKPHAIGIILLLINEKEKNKNIGIVYDFPEKQEKRTTGIGNIHLYNLSVT